MSINNAYLGEETKIYSYHGEMSTRTASSANFRIRADDCEKITFLISAGVTNSSTGLSTIFAGGLQTTILVKQGSSHETATAAGLATASLKVQLGSTVAGTVQRAMSAIVHMSSGAEGGTVGNTITLNGITMTVVSTAVGEAGSTNFYDSTGGFGSSELSTVDGALVEHSAGLRGLINSTFGSSVYPNGGLGSVFRATTNTNGGSTDVQVLIQIRDDANLSSGITLVGSSGLKPCYQTAQAKIEFPVSLMNSTSKYVTLLFSSIATSVKYTAVAIKQGCRYPHGSGFHGNSAIYTTT